MQKTIAFALFIISPLIGLLVGVRWHRAAVPMAVTLYTEDNRTITGNLTQKWSDGYVIQAADGTRHEFAKYAMIKLSLPRQPTWVRVFEWWRVFVAMAVGFLLPIVSALGSPRNNGASSENLARTSN